ncbi:MAG: MerR family transcriptional regulator [Coriobacteriales bacterium]|nr:MerR family transcriptional regulator [Coriobacteriales bacterium]
MPDAGYLTIGKVVKKLQPQYPDLSVSKVRYLEDEGLLNPSRTPGGYRLYSQHDIRRLETILYLQKNRFMPLQVIKEELAKGEFSLAQLMSQTGETTTIDAPPLGTDAGIGPDSQEDLEKYHPLSRMPEILGVSVGFVRELSVAGVIKMRTSPHGRDLVDGHDFPLIRTCEELRQFGIGPRNLRQYVQAANRESGMLEQALTVYGRHGSGSEPTPEQKARYQQALTRMVTLTNSVRETFIRRNLRDTFKDMED